MLIGIGASIYSGNRYDAAISSANLAARFDASLGITSSGGFASAWADQSGNGRNLLQSTGANQPIHLPFTGTKYGWLPGVNGNYFSTPDSVAASITGDIDIRWIGETTTLSADKVLAAKNSGGAGQRSWVLDITAAGALNFITYADGTNQAINATSTATLASAGVTINSKFGARVTLVAATRTVTFYTSLDGGATWTQLGNNTGVGAATTIFDSTSVVELGSQSGGTSIPLSGQIYRAQIYNGIDGTLAVDFDPSRWTSGTTFTAATGETWTINSTGSKPAQIVDRPSLLFDGAAHYMKTDPFTLNQPETVYLVAKPISWTGGDYFIDGETADSMVIYQVTATPNIALYSGTTGPQSTSATLGASHVIGAVFNGANSILQIDSGAASTANAGTRNAGGFTLGMYSGGGFYGNIQVYEALIYNVAHDAATRSNIIRALMSKHGAA